MAGSLSGLHVFNRVFILQITHFLPRSVLYYSRRGAKYTQAVKAISAGINLQTGCGRRVGFSLSDLTLHSLTFSWDYKLLSDLHFARRKTQP